MSQFSSSHNEARFLMTERIKALAQVINATYMIDDHAEGEEILKLALRELKHHLSEDA